jgi:hypothetical protein
LSLIPAADRIPSTIILIFNSLYVATPLTF